MKFKSLLLFGVILLVLCSSAFAVSTVITQVGSSVNLEIKYPQVYFYPIGADIILPFHVYNITGQPLTNTTTSCYFHLYNSATGDHIIDGNNLVNFDAASKFDWEVNLSAKNLSRYGQYSYIFQCNTSMFGGYVADSFLIVQDQNKYLYSPVSSPNYDLALILGLLGIAFFLVFISDRFKVEGESFIKAITAVAINLLFKLSAFAIIIFDILLLRELIPGAVTSFANIYDPMLQFLLYGVGVLFFLLYFINSIATLAYNFRVKQEHKSMERKY